MIPSVIEPATTTNCATAYFHSHLLYYLQNNSLYVEFLTGITLLRKVAMNEHAVTQNTKTGRSSLLHICHLSIKRRCCVVSLLLATVLLTCKCLENALFFFFRSTQTELHSSKGLHFASDHSHYAAANS